jgi:hypothetical protein
VETTGFASGFASSSLEITFSCSCAVRTGKGSYENEAEDEITQG